MRDEGCGGGEDGTGFFLCERCRVLIDVQMRDEVDAKDIAESRARRKAKRTALRAARKAEVDRRLAEIQAEKATLQAEIDASRKANAADMAELQKGRERAAYFRGQWDAFRTFSNFVAEGD